MSVGPTMICSGDMHSVTIEEIESQINCSHLADRNFISHLLVGSNFVFFGGGGSGNELLSSNEIFVLKPQRQAVQLSVPRRMDGCLVVTNPEAQ